MAAILDALKNGSKVELNLAVPKEKEEFIRKNLEIRYGDFCDGRWEAEDSEGKVILYSPTMSMGEAKNVISSSPEYVDIEIKSIFAPYGKKNVLKNPIKVK